MTRREKQWRRILSTSLLDATVPSDEVGSNSDCENRTGTDMKLKELGLVWHSLKEIGTVVLGLATSHCRNWQKLMLKRQVRWVDQTQYPMIVVASLSAVPQSCRTPLLWQVDNRYQNEVLKKHETSKIEVLHLFRCSTHTHFHTQRLSHPAFTHTQTFTHTCSETSYRITDVECIVRAKNTPVNLTGDGEWPGVRNSVEEFCRWNCNNVVDSVFNS